MKNTAFSLLMVANLCLSKAPQAEGYVDLLIGQASSKYSQQVLVSNNNFLYSSHFQTNTDTQNNLAARFGLGGFANDYVGADITYKHFGNTSAYGGNFVFRYKPTPDLQLIAKLSNFKHPPFQENVT